MTKIRLGFSYWPDARRESHAEAPASPDASGQAGGLSGSGLGHEAQAAGIGHGHGLAVMAEGRALWQVAPYIVFFPAVFLSITVLAVNLLGDGLRDALDPRLAKRI